MPDFRIKIPQRLAPVLEEADWKILYGGRSSAKSSTVARYLTALAMRVKNKNILCVRQNKVSLRLSTYADIKNVIYEYELQRYFNIKRENIICTLTNTAIEFAGLEQGGVYNLKSTSNVVACFIEEAEKTTEESWDVLIPTIVRNEGSEIIVVFNPREKESATYKRFITDVHQLAGKVISIEQNYPDNPFLTKKALAVIEALRIHDYPKYEHIYLGKVLDMTEDVIFKGHFKIEHVDIKWIEVGKFWLYNTNQRIQMLYGMDFGFSIHPCAMVELCFLDKDTIYIHREIYETKLLPTKYISKIKQDIHQGIKSKWWGDNSRPDTIEELKQMGLNIEGAEKGKGSVEAGIQYLLGKNIIINPSCTNTIYEFYNYRYKTDKTTGSITTDIIKENDHIIDAMRYALTKQIRAERRSLSTSGMQKYLESVNYGA